MQVKLYFLSSCDKKKCKACDSNKLAKSKSLNICASEVSSTTNCESVLSLTPEDESGLCCVQRSTTKSSMCYFALTLKFMFRFALTNVFLKLQNIIILYLSVYTYCYTKCDLCWLQYLFSHLRFMQRSSSRNFTAES